MGQRAWASSSPPTGGRWTAAKFPFMPYAAFGDNLYNTFLLLHVLTAMAAFAPAFVHPFLTTQSKAMQSERGVLMSFIVANGRRVYAPALVATGILGFGVAGLSKSPGTDELVWQMSQGWLITAFIVWIAMNGVLHAIIFPAEKAIAAGDDSAGKRLDLGGGMISILLVVQLYLMIFKPGL